MKEITPQTSIKMTIKQLIAVFSFVASLGYFIYSMVDTNSEMKKIEKDISNVRDNVLVIREALAKKGISVPFIPSK